jgi:hypothetical protein
MKHVVELAPGISFQIGGIKLTTRAVYYHPDGAVKVAVEENEHGIRAIDFSPLAKVETE